LKEAATPKAYTAFSLSFIVKAEHNAKTKATAQSIRTYFIEL
jgi:hypothetical protein